jgi:hypothetical protein
MVVMETEKSNPTLPIMHTYPTMTPLKKKKPALRVDAWRTVLASVSFSHSIC